MAESRGQKEDTALKLAYERFYNEGTDFRDKEVIQKRITSKHIKLKTKNSQISGIEFADMLSLASRLDTLYRHGELESLSENFCKEIIDKIGKKYRRHPHTKKIEGYGSKLIK